MTMLDRSKAPEVHPLGDLQLPDAQYDVLDNGIVLCSHNGSNAHLTQLSVVVRGGLAEGRLPAIASILAATVTEGAAGMDSALLAATIDFYGARLRAEASTHFITLTLEALTDKLPKLLPLFVDIVTRPNLDEDIFLLFRDREAKMVMHVNAQVAYLALHALNPLLMGAHNPLARVQTVDEVITVERQEIVDFHSRWWCARNMTAYLFGEYSTEIEQLVKQTLLQIPSGEPRDISIHPFEPQAPQRVNVTKEDAQQSAVCMALPTVPRSHPDYLPLRFAVIALGGYFGSRLMKNIREDKGYTYGIQSCLAGQIDGSGIMVSAQCDARYVDDVIQQTGHEMLRLADEPLSPDELQRVCQTVASSLINTVDNAFTLAEYNRLRVVTRIPDDYFQRQVSLIRTLTAADITAMAQRYFLPSQLRIATTT